MEEEAKLTNILQEQLAALKIRLEEAHAASAQRQTTDNNAVRTSVQSNLVRSIDSYLSQWVTHNGGSGTEEFACMQGAEELTHLQSENVRLASLLAHAEVAAEEAGHLRDMLEAEKESRALRVQTSSVPCMSHLTFAFFEPLSGP